MEYTTLFSTSSLDLVPLEKGSQPFSSHSEAPRRNGLLSVAKSIFPHGRSRSADRRALELPPAYDSLSVASLSINRRSKSSSKYSASSWYRSPIRQETLENALELLRKYDTVILVDDSWSMSQSGSKRGKTRWQEAGEALESLADVAAQYDADGIDIFFLNDRTEARNITSAAAVRKVFEQVRPRGATPTAERLEQLLKPYLLKLEAAHIDWDGTPKDQKTNKVIKRVNYIVITDGEATDQPRDPIVHAGLRLKALTHLCMIQLGIQFVQIGNDAKATKALKELDDGLQNMKHIPDIVDTTPYSKLHPLTADGLIKVLLGGINRRIDEKKV